LVRCKFVCTEKIEQPDGSATIKMGPVTCGSEENEQFFQYTPWGELNFGTVNPAAAARIEQGKEYYIDISPAGE